MEPDALAAIGRHISGVADGEIRDGAGAVVTAVRAIAAALPGTRSAGLAEELAWRWERAGTAWASALRAHGEALTAAATGQQAAEHDAAHLLHDAAGPLAAPSPGAAPPFASYREWAGAARAGAGGAP